MIHIIWKSPLGAYAHLHVFHNEYKFWGICLRTWKSYDPLDHLGSNSQKLDLSYDKLIMWIQVQMSIIFTLVIVNLNPDYGVKIELEILMIWLYIVL